MAMTVQEILEAAMLLSQDERDWLARELLHPPGDGSTQEEIDAAWGEEVERRIHEIDSGAVETVSWEEVKSRLQAKFPPELRSRFTD